MRDGEQTALLDLVSRWPTLDDWPMRELLGRYVVDEPAFDPHDVWVAEEAGELASCVQIFPRQLLVRGSAVPVGGIGSVFTKPEQRDRGLAAAVMRAAMEDLRARGFELGLLFAGPVAFYEKLGWYSWPIERPLLRPTGGTDAGAFDGGEPFEPARDLAEVQALHLRYARGRDGICVRDSQRWWTNLRHAGNPLEEFRVARAGGHVVAYLRAACLSRFLVILEWGRHEDAAPELAALFRATLTPRAEDPLAPVGSPSSRFRSVASTPPLLDAALAGALGAVGIEVSSSTDPGGMFWVARPRSLAERFAEPFQPRDPQDARIVAEQARTLLHRLLPPDRFAFWLADRF